MKEIPVFSVGIDPETGSPFMKEISREGVDVSLLVPITDERKQLIGLALNSEDAISIETKIPESMWKDMVRWCKAAWFTARRNATARGIQFDLTLKDVLKLADRSGGKCEVTGIRFDFRFRKVEHSRSAWVPSLDRVVSSGPYSFDNCRLVCCAANLAMNEWGEDVLSRLAFAYVAKHSRAKSRPNTRDRFANGSPSVASGSNSPQILRKSLKDGGLD